MDEPNQEHQHKNDCQNDFKHTIKPYQNRVSKTFTTKLLIWPIRTTIGLTGFGILWHFYDWAAWLFYGYAIVAALSLASILYLRQKAKYLCEKVEPLCDGIEVDEV